MAIRKKKRAAARRRRIRRPLRRSGAAPEVGPCGWFVEAVYNHHHRQNIVVQDAAVLRYAERRSDHSGADVGGACQRDIAFDCATYDEAVALQAKLADLLILGVIHRVGIGHYAP